MKLAPDIVMLVATIMLFVDFLVNKNQHTGMLWVYIAYITGCIIRIALLQHWLDKYVTIFAYREKIGLVEGFKPQKSVLTWVVTGIMLAAGIFVIIHFLFL